MKKYGTIITLLVLLLFGCTRIPKGYIKYQTFDEYSLTGISTNDSLIKEPFVAVKTNSKMISVLICESYSKKKVVEYIKHGDYWYNLKKIQEKYHSDCACDTTPYYIEKFIYNDTIMKYGYYLENGKRKYNENLVFSTKNEIISLSDSDAFKIDENRKFYQLKQKLVNYKSNFEHYSNSPKYQKRYYHYYRKELRADTLFTYEIIENPFYKIGDIIDARKLNSLGEFDQNDGVSVLSDILQQRAKTK